METQLEGNDILYVEETPTMFFFRTTHQYHGREPTKKEMKRYYKRAVAPKTWKKLYKTWREHQEMIGDDDLSADFKYYKVLPADRDIMEKWEGKRRKDYMGDYWRVYEKVGEGHYKMFAKMRCCDGNEGIRDAIKDICSKRLVKHIKEKMEEKCDDETEKKIIQTLMMDTDFVNSMMEKMRQRSESKTNIFVSSVEIEDTQTGEIRTEIDRNIFSVEPNLDDWERLGTNCISKNFGKLLKAYFGGDMTNNQLSEFKDILKEKFPVSEFPPSPQ